MDHSSIDITQFRNLQFERMRLKTATRNSAFFAGFGIIGIVEITTNKEYENQLPIAIWYYFALSTTLLSGFHLFAVLISSCLLPHIDKSCLDEVMTESDFRDSPHIKMSPLIFIAWICANVIGLIMFFLQLIAIVWVKYWEVGIKRGTSGKRTAAAASAFLLFFLSVFVFIILRIKYLLEQHTKERTKVHGTHESMRNFNSGSV